MKIPSPELFYLVCAALAATAAAACDLETRRIPNWLVASSMVFGLLLHISLGGWASMGWAVLAGLVGGAVFFAFFVMGGMGAGDIKLLAAVSLIAGFGHLAEIYIAIAFTGGVFALVLALVRGRFGSTVVNMGRLVQHHAAAGLLPHPELNVMNSKALRLPYAVAIAGGCWIVLAAQIALS